MKPPPRGWTTALLDTGAGNIAGGFTVHVTGGHNIIVNGDLSVAEKDYKLTDRTTGDEVNLKVYLLFNSAAWSSRSSSKLITYKDKEITLYR
jgi:hypothetical protein